jgi:hypothetical protein
LIYLFGAFRQIYFSRNSLKGINRSAKRKLDNANTISASENIAPIKIPRVRLQQLILPIKQLNSPMRYTVINSLHTEVFKEGGDGKLNKNVETNTDNGIKLNNIKLYTGAEMP